jgi:hypothetical protein
MRRTAGSIDILGQGTGCKGCRSCSSDSNHCAMIVYYLGMQRLPDSKFSPFNQQVKHKKDLIQLINYLLINGVGNRRLILVNQFVINL